MHECMAKFLYELLLRGRTHFSKVFFHSSLMYRDKVRFLSCIRQKKQLLVSKLMQLLFLQLWQQKFFY